MYLSHHVALMYFTLRNRLIQNSFQQSTCVCLHYLLLTSTYIRTPCNTYPAKCQGDQNAFCGDTKPNSDAFAIYQTGSLLFNIIERRFVCLAFVAMYMYDILCDFFGIRFHKILSTIIGLEFTNSVVFIFLLHELNYLD